MISSSVRLRSSPLAVPSSISRIARATRFVLTYSIASCGRIKPVMVACGRTFSSTARPSARMTLLSSTRMTLVDSSLPTAAESSVATSTSSTLERRAIIAASGRRVPFSQRVTVELLTDICFPSPICESPLSVLSFFIVSANIVFMIQILHGAFFHDKPAFRRKQERAGKKVFDILEPPLEK